MDDDRTASRAGTMLALAVTLFVAGILVGRAHARISRLERRVEALEAPVNVDNWPSVHRTLDSTPE